MSFESGVEVCTNHGYYKTMCPYILYQYPAYIYLKNNNAYIII